MKELELILTHILDCSRSELYLKRFSWNKERLSKFYSTLIGRKFHFPLAYLLGEIEFMGLNFKVSEEVFIPRQETEILVEKVLNLTTNYKLQTTNLKILDIGTGCGNIAVSLAKFLACAKIFATDISLWALDIAKENAKRNKLKEKIEFIQADLFDIKHKIPNVKQFDIIVSNPPYIPTDQIEFLPLEVQFEPKEALDGGWDGLDFYRRIAKSSPKFLKKDGFLVLEIGFGQCEKIVEILNSKDFKIIEIIKDYSRIDRVIVAQKRESRDLHTIAEEISCQKPEN